MNWPEKNECSFVVIVIYMTLKSRVDLVGFFATKFWPNFEMLRKMNIWLGFDYLGNVNGNLMSVV